MNWSIAGLSRSVLTRSNCLFGLPHHLTTCGSASHRRTKGKSFAVMGRNSYMQLRWSGAVQRLDGDVAIGKHANFGSNIERFAHDGLGIERSVEQRAGGRQCIVTA